MKIRAYHPFMGGIEVEVADDSPVAKAIMKGQVVGVSMQEPRASLDHFIGRLVESVWADTDEATGADEPGKWGITLEGGITISNKDKTLAEAPDVGGKMLMSVVLSETETRILFGHSGPSGIHDEEWVTLNPTQYTISGLEGQTKEFYPQMPEELEEALPRDPSPDRIAPGPSEEALAAQVAREKALAEEEEPDASVSP